MGEVFEPLKDPDVFRCFRVDTELDTIVWATGADLAPSSSTSRQFSAPPHGNVGNARPSSRTPGERIAQRPWRAALPGAPTWPRRSTGSSRTTRPDLPRCSTAR